MKLNRIAPLLIIIIIIAATVIGQQQSGRRIPDNHLSLPVAITRAGANAPIGSGFYLHDATSQYLVTAKHVLYDGSTLRAASVDISSPARDLNDKTFARYRLSLSEMAAAGALIPHVSQDVVIARIGSVRDDAGQLKVTPLPGVQRLAMPPSGTIGARLNQVLRYAEVLIANEVIVFGYPASIGMRQVPQIDFTRPLLRRGIVAGTNDTLKSIIIDTPLHPGNSGGPVIQVTTVGRGAAFHVIGVAIQQVPFEHRVADPDIEFLLRANSGYSIAASMDSVLELITNDARPRPR
jgi:hypothetical protein